MRVRDAVEADAEAMAAIADGPTDVMRNLVHDRTVRVAVRTGTDTDEGSGVDADSDNVDSRSDSVDADSSSVGADSSSVDAESESDGVDLVEHDDVVGIVSFDAREEVVHVTQIDGTPDACELLLAEPVRFAQNEGMRVELLVTDTEGDVATAAERVGFERDGPGPRFDGQSTVRYHLSPA